MMCISLKNQVNVIRNKYASIDANKFISKTPIKDFNSVSGKQLLNNQNKQKQRRQSVNILEYNSNAVQSKKSQRTGKICKNKSNNTTSRQIKSTRQRLLQTEKSLTLRKQPLKMYKYTNENNASQPKKISQFRMPTSLRNNLVFQLQHSAKSTRQSTTNNCSNKLIMDSLRCIQNVEKLQSKIKQILSQK